MKKAIDSSRKNLCTTYLSRHQIIFFNLACQNTEFLFMCLNDSYRTEIDSRIQPSAFQSELLTRWKNSRWIKVIKIQLII